MEGGSLRAVARAARIERFTYGSVRGSRWNSPGLLGNRDVFFASSYVVGPRRPDARRLRRLPSDRPRHRVGIERAGIVPGEAWWYKGTRTVGRSASAKQYS